MLKLLPSIIALIAVIVFFCLGYISLFLFPINLLVILFVIVVLYKGKSSDWRGITRMAMTSTSMILISVHISVHEKIDTFIVLLIAMGFLLLPIIFDPPVFWGTHNDKHNSKK